MELSNAYKIHELKTTEIYLSHSFAQLSILKQKIQKLKFILLKIYYSDKVNVNLNNQKSISYDNTIVVNYINQKCKFQLNYNLSENDSENKKLLTIVEVSIDNSEINSANIKKFDKSNKSKMKNLFDISFYILSYFKFYFSWKST